MGNVGNIVAGYVAGYHGLPYLLSRVGFDGYQTYSESRKVGHLVLTREGITTRNAQFKGWLLGSSMRSKKYPL